MSWKVRHEGSPKHVEGLTPEQVLQGLLDMQFEPTDEVQGPGETTWTALENHPQFAEAAAEIEAPPPRVYDDETRLDMNALIDVCLVLLIFFILTTVYASQELLLEAAGSHSEKPGDIREISADKFDDVMALLTLKKSDQGDGVIVRVVTKKQGQKEVALEISRADASDKQRLLAFKEKLREGIEPLVQGGLRTVMIDFLSDQIPHEVAVAVKDGARAAGITEVLYKVE